MPDSAQPFRWKFYDPLLLALFPITYVLHLAEEWFAAAPIAHWTMRADRPLDAPFFIGANGIGLSLMLVGIRLAHRTTAFRWIAPALAAAVLLNTAGHFAGTIAAGGYSAGLFTAVIFWLPLGMLTLLRACDQASRPTLVAGIAAGVVIELIVVATLPAVGLR
jgi:hypothetical protein